MPARSETPLPEIAAHFVGNEPLPAYLAAPLLVNLGFTQEGQLAEQIARLEAITSRIAARTAGAWHVEATALSPWYVDVLANPAVQSAGYVAHTKFSRDICLTPRLFDPGDLAQRGTLAEILGDALSDPEFFMSLPLLVDWVVAPLVRETHGRQGDFRDFQGPYQSLVPNTAALAERLRTLRAARHSALAPFLEGRRMVRNPDAFARFHAKLDEQQAMAIASLVRSNKLELGPKGAGYDQELRELALLGWCRIDQVTVNQGYSSTSRQAEVAIRVGYSRKLWPAELLAN